MQLRHMHCIGILQTRRIRLTNGRTCRHNLQLTNLWWQPNVVYADWRWWTLVASTPGWGIQSVIHSMHPEILLKLWTLDLIFNTWANESFKSYFSIKSHYYLFVETTQVSIRPLHYFILLLTYVEITRTIYLATVSWSSEVLNAFQHVEKFQPATSGPTDKFFLRGCLSMGAAAAAVITHQRLLMTCTMTRHHPTLTGRHSGAVFHHFSTHS